MTTIPKITLGGKAWLVGVAIAAPPAETLAVGTISAVAGSPYTISGTYTNGPPTALDYSTDGAQAVWTAATAGLTIGGGTYSFTAAALSAGNYTVSVRDHNSQAIIGTHALVVSVPAPTVGSGSIDSFQTFRRDPVHWTGNPAGFSTTYNKGWGQVTFTVTPSANTTAQLSIRLRDGNPSGNPGTFASPGTIIQPWMTIPGGPFALTTAGTLVNVNIPASTNFYIADIALSSDLTTGITVTGSFGTGYVLAVAGDSIAAGMVSDYYYYGGTESSAFPSIVAALGGAIDPKARTFAPTCSNFNVAHPTFGAPGTGLWDVVTDSATGIYNSPFPAAFLPALMAKLGVLCALTGWCGPGKTLFDYDPDTNSQWQNAFLPVLQHSNYNVDALFMAIHNLPSSQPSIGEWGSRLRSVGEALRDKGSPGMALYACSVPLGGFGGASPGISDYLSNTGLDYAYSRATKAFPKSDVFRSRRPQRFPQDFVNFHSSLITRLDWGYSLARLIADSTDGVQRDPDITSVTRSGAVITVTVSRPMGTKLVAHRSMQPSTTSWSNAVVATSDGAAMSNTDSTQFAQLFWVFECDASGLPAASTPTITTSGISAKNLAFAATSPFQFTGPTSFTLTLAADPGAGVALEMHYGIADGWGMDAPTLGFPSIRDDSVDTGIPYGRELRRKIVPIYIPAPGAATTLTLTNVSNLTSGVTVAPGAVCVASGAFGGAQPTGIDFQIDGGAWTAGMAANEPAGITPFGVWQASFISPSGLGAHTVSARMTGTTAPVAGPFSFTVAASDLPLSSAGLTALATGLVLDPRRLGTMFTDAARTTPAVDASRVSGIADASGAGNHLTSPSFTPARLVLDHQNGLPAVQNTALGYDLRYYNPAVVSAGVISNPIPIYRTGNGTLAQALRGDFTIVTVSKQTSGGGELVSACGFRDATNGGNSIQMLDIGAGFVNRINTYPAQYAAPALADGLTHSELVKQVVRFQASTGTAKLKISGATEISRVATGDYSTGDPWKDFTVLAALGNTNSNTTSFGGGFHFLAVVPGYYATDAEVTALLAWADRLYQTNVAVSLSATSGVHGNPVTVTLTPSEGGWPVGAVCSPNVTGGTLSPATAAPTAGSTTPQAFTFTPTAAGTFTIGVNCYPLVQAGASATYTAS